LSLSGRGLFHSKKVFFQVIILKKGIERIRRGKEEGVGGKTISQFLFV
jgi:hypothetical protein